MDVCTNALIICSAILEMLYNKLQKKMKMHENKASQTNMMIE